MENQSTLATEYHATSPIWVNALTQEPASIPVELTAYLFNNQSQVLYKTTINLNYPLVDVIELTPWGVIGLNSSYELVNLEFLPSNFFLMNTPDYPCLFKINNQEVIINNTVQLYDLSTAKKVKINADLNFLKEKKIHYPVFNQTFMDKNQKFLSEEQLLSLFAEVFASPIDNLENSLDIFDHHLKSTNRIFGNRWSSESRLYYCESKLAELDRSDFSAFNSWSKGLNIWEVGQVLVIAHNHQNFLVEVLSIHDQGVTVLNRQYACTLIQSGKSKPEAQINSQMTINFSEINNFFLITN